MIGVAFLALSLYIAIQSGIVLAERYHARHSPLGIAWTSITALVMFSLAAGKARTGVALGNPVLQTEGRVTLIDGLLASAVLLGLILNAALGAWWADPLAGRFGSTQRDRTVIAVPHSWMRVRVDKSRTTKRPGSASAPATGSSTSCPASFTHRCTGPSPSGNATAVIAHPIDAVCHFDQ